MIAAYHLQNEDYTIIGSAPKSLYNSFMNPVMFNLPKSNLYMTISTGRFYLNENVDDRAADQLIPDYPTDVDLSLEALLNGIRQIEAAQ